MRKKLAVIALAWIAILPLFSQEVLLSTTEKYYNFLALDGFAERPYLNYRTLSDSEWDITDSSGDIWSGNNLGSTREITDDISYKVYGPEIFTSYNTTSPYGQNDGALWQGKGLNSSLSAGARLEGFGFELTLKPEAVFSQNLAFDLVPPAYSGATYEGKADTYGYFGVPSIDAPQRFGDETLFDFSWGDSEIRYTWKTLTAGFGTQLIWLGPAQINPILHSNNATPYPKVDVGLRKTTVTLPWIHWYMGDVEARSWWGRTSESEWFDSDSENNHNLITALSLSFSPSFAPGLSLGYNRTMLSTWDSMDASAILTLLNPYMDNDAGSDERDQRVSLSFEYELPAAGADVYLEWGRNDFSPATDYIVRYPFHTHVYTIGGKKSFKISDTRKISGQFIAEVTMLESSRDYELLGWKETFYAHHIISQGYTNGGQWLGAGMGTGGNSQYMGFELFYPKGNTKIFVQRANTDNDYVWYKSNPGDHAARLIDQCRFRTDLSAGLSGIFYMRKQFCLNYGLTVIDTYSWEYGIDSVSSHRYNVNIRTGLSVAY